MADSLDIKMLNECQRLLDMFSIDAKYNPSNKRLAIAALEAALTTGFPIVENISVKLAPQKIDINNRQSVNERILDFAKKSRRYLKSSGASAAEIADAQTILKPILGSSKPKPPTENPDTPAAKAIASHALSQRSSAGILAALVAYRQFAANVTAYAPNETDVKLTTADSLISEAQAATNAVNAGFAPLSRAWNERDQKLYTDATSILNDFRAAKEYYKSLYNAKDPEYRSVTAIQLKDNSRDIK